MSIIYDALKKIEKTSSRDIIKEVNNERKDSKLQNYLIYALVICVGLFLANIAFTVISPEKGKPSQQTLTTPTAQIQTKTQAALVPAAPSPAVSSSKKVETKPKEIVKTQETTPAPVAEVKKTPQIPPLILNGIFYSKRNGYAIINNRVVKKGDSIEGIEIKNINSDFVELITSDGLTFKLSTQNQ